MKILIALAAGLVVASSLPSFGQNLNFDLTGNGGLQGSGNSLTFTSNGVTATATAYSYTRNDDTSFEKSQLGRYGSSGLGVTNKFEDGSSPEHRVDNFKHNDYILFTFDDLVDVSSVQIASVVDDSDVSYWVGNISSNNLTGKNYSGLSSLGFQDEQIDMFNSSVNSRTVTINSPSNGINAILFGTQRGLDSGDYLDQFKVQHIKATVVPEPSAALLSVLGAFGFCLRRRRI